MPETLDIGGPQECGVCVPPRNVEALADAIRRLAADVRLKEMGRKYLCTLLMLYFQRKLISDDLVAERLSANQAYQKNSSGLESRIAALEKEME